MFTLKLIQEVEQMTEKAIESRLVNEVKKRGGVSYKFVSPGNVGVPDRIVILPGGEVWFVELKTETGRLSAMQEYQIKRMINVGARVAVLHGAEDVKRFMENRAAEQGRAKV